MTKEVTKWQKNKEGRSRPEYLWQHEISRHLAPGVELPPRRDEESETTGRIHFGKRHLNESISTFKERLF